MNPIVALGADACGSPTASRTVLSPIGNNFNRPAVAVTPRSAAVHIAEGQCDILTPIGLPSVTASQPVGEAHESLSRVFPGTDADAVSVGQQLPGGGEQSAEVVGVQLSTHAAGAGASRPDGAMGSTDMGCSTQDLSRQPDHQSQRIPASPDQDRHHSEPSRMSPDAAAADEPGIAAANETRAGSQAATESGDQLSQGAGSPGPLYAQQGSPVEDSLAGAATQRLEEHAKACSPAVADRSPATHAASQADVSSQQHGEHIFSQETASGMPPRAAQPAGPRGALLARVTAELSGADHAGSAMPQWLTERLAAFPDCLLDACKTGEPANLG